MPDGYERLKIMGMFDPKKRKLVTAIIAVILVLAMVVPAVLSSSVGKRENEAWKSGYGSTAG